MLAILQTLSLLREELYCHWHHTRWVCSCSSRARPKMALSVKCNILELARRRQQNCRAPAASVHIEMSSERRTTENHAQTQLNSCWAHREPQQRADLVLLPWSKQWHQATQKPEKCWASQAKLGSLSLLCSFPAFSHNLQCYYSDAQHQRIELLWWLLTAITLSFKMLLSNWTMVFFFQSQQLVHSLKAPVKIN